MARGRSGFAVIAFAAAFGSLVSELALFRSSRSVIGEHVKVDAVGSTDRFSALVRPFFGCGRFVDDARQKEVAGVLEILHQLDVAITRTDDAKMDGNLTVFYTRFQSCDLDACGQNCFQIFHGEGPGEGLLIKYLIEILRLLEGARVLRLLHHGLILLAFVSEVGNFSVERMNSGASGFSLVVDEMQSQPQAGGNQHKRTHGDSQTLKRRGDVCKWP